MQISSVWEVIIATKQRLFKFCLIYDETNEIYAIEELIIWEIKMSWI